MDIQVKIKNAEIKAEQNKYKCTMSFDEMIERQAEYERVNNFPPLSLEEINQYIDEVRKNGKDQN